LHRLSSNFILGYHGCDRRVGEQLLRGAQFKLSDNDYDWLGPGIYFWEANPQRGLEFALEASGRSGSQIKDPFAIGAVIELGLCLDLTTSAGLAWVRLAHKILLEVTQTAGLPLPSNSGDQLHTILAAQSQPAIDTVKGAFTEGAPLYPGSGFREKTHIQIAVRNPDCIKGVFRVPLP
jgi:hypothetical protein